MNLKACSRSSSSLKIMFFNIFESMRKVLQPFSFNQVMIQGLTIWKGTTFQIYTGNKQHVMHNRTGCKEMHMYATCWMHNYMPSSLNYFSQKDSWQNMVSNETSLKCKHRLHTDMGSLTSTVLNCTSAQLVLRRSSLHMSHDMVSRG